MHHHLREDLLNELIETEDELANVEAELNETPPDIQPWWNLRAEVTELKTRLSNLRLQLANDPDYNRLVATHPNTHHDPRWVAFWTIITQSFDDDYGVHLYPGIVAQPVEAEVVT